MKMLLIAAFMFVSIHLWAQKSTGYARVGRIMLQIPDSSTNTADGIARYINSKFVSQTEKSRAVFIWIVRNISYSFDSMFSVHAYPKPEEITRRILKTKTGVCLHYASLFSEIANQVGVRSYVVQGYIKQQGKVAPIPHMWCVGHVDSVWCLFDPTWGAGYVSDSRFIRVLNNSYFMAKPENLIRSHMPFDPLWQLLTHPITADEFYKGNYRNAVNRPYFNFADTLKVYEGAAEYERAVAAARRIEANGVKNSFTEAKLRILRNDIENYRNKERVDQFNAAVNYFNAGVAEMNRFIAYGNNQFLPETDTLSIIHMLDSAAFLLKASAEKLTVIENSDLQMAVSIMQLNTSISEASEWLKKQRVSLDRYLVVRRRKK
jgi:hypothetical protein